MGPPALWMTFIKNILCQTTYHWNNRTSILDPEIAPVNIIYWALHFDLQERIAYCVLILLRNIPVIIKQHFIYNAVKVNKEFHKVFIYKYA